MQVPLVPESHREHGAVPNIGSVIIEVYVRDPFGSGQLRSRRRIQK